MIVPGLYLGDRSDAQDKDKLVDLGISHILNCAKQLPCYHEDDFVYTKLEMLDTPQFDVRPFFESACDFIEAARTEGTAVMVHCISGVSRAPTMVLAYLVLRLRYPLAKAWSLVLSRRKICKPNDSFLMALVNLEVSCMETSSVADSTDPVWQFYELNRVRRALPRPAPRPSSVCAIM